MGEMGNKLSEADLMKALMRWRADNISSDQLRKVVDSYLEGRQSAFEGAGPAGAGLAGNRLAGDGLAGDGEPQAPAIRTFASMEAEDAVKASAAKVYQSPSFEAYETVPYEPLADVVDEPRRAWIPDGWGLYYMVDDFLYRVSYGFLTLLNLTIMFGFLIIVGVLFGAWQISMSNERQKKATYKSMTSSSSSRDQPRVAPELSAPTKVDLTDSPSSGDSDTSSSSNPLSNSSSATSATEESSATVESPNRLDPIQATEPELTKATIPNPFDKAIELLQASDLPGALAEIEILEAGSQADLQPILTFLKVESLIRKRDNESMELARQLLMDCKSSGHELANDLLVSRWMLMCGAEGRERFLRESASLPIESRGRMVNWARVRSGGSDAILESELESNAPRTPNSVCDRLFLASCRFNAGKSEQSRRELLDVEQKIRALNTRGFGKAEIWLIESSKKQLASKVAEIATLIGRKQIN